jgi:MSHA biogenesis protein MshL
MKFMGLQSCPVNLKYWVVLFSVFIASCASQGELREKNAEPRLENLVEVQPAPSSRSFKEEEDEEEDKVLLELTLPQTELVPKKPRDKGPRFSLSAEEVDVKTILFSISKEIDQNIMIDPVISKKVTLNLKEVSLKEMLDHVLLPLNLMYEVDEKFIRVIPLEMQTRIFRLNYLISKREGLGNLQASLGAGTYEVPQMGVGGSSQIFSSEETDLWKEIALGLQKMVANERPGETLDTSLSMGEPSVESAWFSVNKQAGVLVVRAYPEVLLQVAEFLEEVEGSVQRQVLIRARVIKVALKDEFPRGIDWKQLTSLNTSDLKAGPASDSRGYLPGNQEERVDEMLEALALQGDVSVLASPQIAALNNQRAVIRVGTEDTIFVPNTAQSIAEGEAAYISRPITLGVVLDVVPQINVNGNVIMSVHANVSKKAGERVSPDGLNRVPVVDIRESNNVVMARNGQTVVIGGLLRRTKEPREDSKTALEQVPIIGEMFHEDLTTYEKSELLILLTPQIMVGDAIEDRLRIEEKRLKRFGGTRQSHKMKTSLEGK